MKGMFRKGAAFRRRTGMLFLILAVFMSGAAVHADDLVDANGVRHAYPTTNELPAWPQMDDITENACVLMDADNGGIMAWLNGNEQRVPASTTKIMTCLLTLENAEMDEIVTMTEAGIEYTVNGSSNAATSLGEQFTVKDCLYMLMLKSANDIAAQLAEHVGGTVDDFVAMMNERAAGLGCKNTHFHNPNGMPDDEHWTTAYDLALIMQECLKNETFREIISTRIWHVPPTNMMSEERIYQNHCALILEDSEYYYPDCIGGKTGYTDLAWRTLVCAAERDGRTLICVVMHGYEKSDFRDAKKLFEYGFNNFVKRDINGISVNIPPAADEGIVEESVKENGDGTVTVKERYGNMTIGTATMAVDAFNELRGIATPTPTAEPEKLDADSAAVSNPNFAADTAGLRREEWQEAADSDRRIPVRGLAVLLALLAGGLVIALFYKIRIDRERKKLREARRERLRKLREAEAEGKQEAPPAGQDT